MTKNSNKGCILCGDNPKEGMNLTGQRIIKDKSYPYSLCKKCCLDNHEYSDNGFNRKKLWSLVDGKLSNNKI